MSLWATRLMVAAILTAALAGVAGLGERVAPNRVPAAVAADTTTASGHWEGPGDCMACHRHHRG